MTSVFDHTVPKKIDEDLCLHFIKSVINQSSLRKIYGGFPRSAREIKEGDILWSVFVPPLYTPTVAALSYTNKPSNDDRDAMYRVNEHNYVNGFEFGLVATRLTLLKDGETADGKDTITDGKYTCTIDDPLKEYATLAFDENYGGEPKQVLHDFAQQGWDNTPYNVWVGVGVKINKIPEGKRLEDITGQFIVGCHARGYGYNTV